MVIAIRFQPLGKTTKLGHTPFSEPNLAVGEEAQGAAVFAPEQFYGGKQRAR